MRRLGAVVVVGSVALLAGCAAESSQHTGVTVSPTASASVTAAPSPPPTPSSEVEDLSDEGLGIVFEDVPTDLTGDEADVYNTVATFQVEYWRALTTNRVSPGFSVISSPDIRDTIERIASNNAADSAQIGGTFRTRVHDVAVDGDTATAAVCDDHTEGTFEDVNGPATPEQAGFGEATSRVVELKRVESHRWIVGVSTVAGPC